MGGWQRTKTSLRARKIVIKNYILTATNSKRASKAIDFRLWNPMSNWASLLRRFH